MIHESLARRYAQALFIDGEKEDCLDRLQEDFGLLSDLLTENESFRIFLYGRMTTVQNKKKLIEDVFPAVLHPLMLSFLVLLLDKGREDGLSEIAAAFRTIVAESKGIVQAQVKTAFPLSYAQQTRLIEKLNALTGKRVEPEFGLDFALIGGLTVVIGDTVYDGSLAKQLQKLSQEMQN